MKRLAAGDQVDIDNVWFTLGDFLLNFNLTEEELLAELRSGRINAKGTPIAEGYKDIFITGDEFCRWVVRDDIPESIKERLSNYRDGTAPSVTRH